MLGKLFKHDMRANSKLLFPATLLVVGLALLGTLALRVITSVLVPFLENDSGVAWFLTIGLGTLCAMSVFAIFVYSVATSIMVVVHYYRNLFTGEGYLTFTLPVTTGNILVSKLLSSVLWMFISAVVAILCFAVMILFGLPWELGVQEDILMAFEEIAYYTTMDMGDTNALLMGIEYVGLMVVGTFTGILQIFLSITIGAMSSRKHKILASIGCYYLISMIISVAQSVLTLLFGSGTLATVAIFNGEAIMEASEEAVGMGVYHGMMIISLVLSLIIAVTEYLITYYMLKKKLNI